MPVAPPQKGTSSNKRHTRSRCEVTNQAVARTASARVIHRNVGRRVRPRATMLGTQDSESVCAIVIRRTYLWLRSRTDLICHHPPCTVHFPTKWNVRHRIGLDSRSDVGERWADSGLQSRWHGG